MEHYLELLTDPAHWAFEITLQVLIDGIVIGVGWKLFRKWHHRHDIEVHGGENG